MCDVIVRVAYDADRRQDQAASLRVQEPLCPRRLVGDAGRLELGVQAREERSLIAEEHEDVARADTGRDEIAA